MSSLVESFVMGSSVIGLIAAACWVAVRAVRWAKKAGAARAILTHGLLFLAVPAVPVSPQQTVVQIAEEKIKKKDNKNGELENSDRFLGHDDQPI